MPIIPIALGLGAILTIGAVTYGVGTDIVDNVAGTATQTASNLDTTLIVIALGLGALYVLAD